MVAPGAMGYAAVRAGCFRSQVVRHLPTTAASPDAHRQAVVPASLAVAGFGRACGVRPASFLTSAFTDATAS